MYKKGKVFIALTLVLAMLVSTCSAAAYTVQKGDNLWKLAAKFFGKGQEYTKIVEANPEIEDPNLIYVGQELIIPEDGVSADEAIVSVTTEGFVDTDGAKASKIIVEYNVDLTGAEVSIDMFEVFNYGIAQGNAKCEIGSDPGKPIAATVEGNKIIIDLNVDYQLASVCKKYPAAMAAGVKQIKDITVGDTTVKAGTKEIGNYTHQTIENVKPNGNVSIDEWDLANDGTYVIKGIDMYEINTFSATNCFEEATGEYMDVDLPYALYVPEDYDATKEYALAVQILDAGFLGTDAMITLTESQACANFASAEIQQIVKDEHGLAGIIVVAPQIEEDLRSTRDNWSLSAAVPATWQLLDYLTETYNINTDYIYGTGQSMGGMQIVAMAAQRDNYFAGIWANGCQWGSNHNLEDGYKGATYYEAPVDGVYITGMDADGNEVDYRNWYYMLSDDNVLITNCVGDAFSTTTWKELDYLYHDLAGAELISENYKAVWNPLTASKEEQNAAAKAIFDKADAESSLGYVWTAFEGGNHMATWIYSHGVKAHYEWLLSRTQDTIEARGKLECLKNNFEYADEQLTTEDRYIGDLEGEKCYFATGKAGAGTADYNGFWMNMGGKSVLKAPNWKATTIPADKAIEEVTTIAFMDVDGPKVKAIVVEYDTELTAGSVDLETYNVYSYTNLEQVFDVGEGNGGSGTEPYATLPTFEYKGDVEPGVPVKVYVSASPEIDLEGKGDESGNYVVIEINTDYRLASVGSDWRAGVAGGVQQMKDIVAGDLTIKASDKVKGNYEPGYFWDINPMGSNHSVTLQKVFDDSLYTLEGLEGYVIYTDNTVEGHTEFHANTGKPTDRDVTYEVPDATVLSKVAGGAFKATNCFSEFDGEYHDVSMMYSLFVPEDYEEQVAAGKKFALALHIVDAGAGGTDPMIALTEAQTAANYASDRVQQLAKDQGLGGLIVVVPQFTKDDQTMADNLTGNEFVPATWQLLDYLTDTYEIDMNRIYGSGQSMGGMQVLDMAAQRDNYFAAIWSIGSQWGNNYNKEEVYGRGKNAHEYYTYPTDGTIITNPDWQNWYYSISDDNILVTNMTGDATATGYWQQVANLYKQFANVTFPYTEWDPIALSVDEQNALLNELVSQENELGIYWNALSNGGHRATWIYSHAISASYDWLLQQTKADEDARGKLEGLAGVYADGEGTLYYNTMTQSAATIAES